MKNILKFMLFSLGIVALASCEKDENKVQYLGGTAPVLTASSTAPLVLTVANKDNPAVTFYWTNPNYQFNTGISSQDVSYTLQFDTTGSNFTNPKMGQKSVSKDLSTTLTVKELNTILLGMGLTENVAYSVEIRVKSTLANSSAPLYSNVIKITMTPYLDVVYPVPAKLYITGSATPGNWMGGGDPELVSQRFTKINASTFQLTVTLSANNSYLFVPVYGDWNNKYGGTGANNTNNVNGDAFKPNGGDMKAPATTKPYTITVDFKTGTWTVQ
ncbi:MAG TPA: SusE domain-containing protein [Ferruginibacter sp.]|nr:SusE domain-containing protein [Ferruginibacter sp.]